MKIILKTAAAVIIVAIAICAVALFTDNSRFGNWNLQQKPVKDTGLAWAPFYWTGDSSGNRYFEKSAMFIPATIEGLPNRLAFQWDLGSDLTMLYEKNALSVFANQPGMLSRMGRLKSPLQFWNRQKAFNNLTLNFGNIAATSPYVFLKTGYGETILPQAMADTMPIHMGTIGADLFQGKILIIDYPGQRFAICDVLPDTFTTAFTTIELDKAGRVILPITVNGKTMKALFDNGSSLFPLLVTENRIADFSTAPDVDSIAISSWGTTHQVTGKLMKDSITIAGMPYGNIHIYTDHRKEAQTSNYDAILGNALFWNKTIIIDFKNKRFGLM